MRKLTLKLTTRRDGRVAKRIDGQYFTWADETTGRAALIELIKQRDAGVIEATVPAIPHDPPLRVLANLFRAERVGKVKPGTWADYETAIDQFLAGVGKHRRASDLRPADFEKVRSKWAAALGPWKIDNRVQAVRTMFNWALKVSRIIQREPWYGGSFGKTTASEKRRVARDHVAEHGERKFTVDELRKILRVARPPLRAFILLGLNGGMYAADIAQLRHADLRRDGRWLLIDNDREKTGVRRRFVLWPETISAMKKCRKGEDVLFETAHGNPWVNGETNSIAQEFTDLLTALKIKRGGVGFGALRHTHVSAVGDHPDLNAARLVRGHKFSGIEAHYDFPDLRRIRAVTDLARRRLLTNVLRQKRRQPKSRQRSAPAR